MVGLDNTIVNVGLPSIGHDLHAGVSGPAVDGRRLHHHAGRPADVLRRARGPDRAPDGLPGRAVPVHPGLVAVQPGSQPGLADRLPGPAGRRRLHAQPGRPRHHHQHVHRPRRAGPGHRGVGRRVRPVHGAGAGAGRRPGRGGRLARDLLGQHPGRPGRRLADRAVRAGVQGAARPARRPGWASSSSSSCSGRWPTRSSRAPPRLALAPDRGVSSGWPRPRWPCCSPTSRAATEPMLDFRFFRSVPFAGANLTAVCAIAAHGRIPVPVHPVPAGRAGLVRPAGGPDHLADAGGDGAVRAAGGPHGGQARPAGPAGHRGRGAHLEQRGAVPADQRDASTRT